MSRPNVIVSDTTALGTNAASDTTGRLVAKTTAALALAQRIVGLVSAGRFADAARGAAKLVDVVDNINAAYPGASCMATFTIAAFKAKDALASVRAAARDATTRGVLDTVARAESSIRAVNAEVARLGTKPVAGGVIVDAGGAENFWPLGAKFAAGLSGALYRSLGIKFTLPWSALLRTWPRSPFLAYYPGTGPRAGVAVTHAISHDYRPVVGTLRDVLNPGAWARLAWNLVTLRWDRVVSPYAVRTFLRIPSAADMERKQTEVYDAVLQKSASWDSGGDDPRINLPVMSGGTYAGPHKKTIATASARVVQRLTHRMVARGALPANVTVTIGTYTPEEKAAVEAGLGK